MKKKIIFASVIFLVVFVIVIGSVLKRQDIEVGNNLPLVYGTSKLTPHSFVTSKLVSGVVDYQAEKKVFFDATKGEVAKVHVNIGDVVSVGDTLFEYSKALVDKERSQLLIEQKSLSLAVKQCENKVTLLNEEKNRLLALPAPEEGEVDNKAEKLMEIDEQLLALEIDKETNAIKRQELDAALRIQATLEASLVVKSDFSGTVIRVGDKNAQASTEPFIHIVAQDMVVRAEVSEFVREQLALGSQVSLTAKAILDKTWTGEVIEIGDRPSTQNEENAYGEVNISNFPIVVRLTDFSGLTAGYHVSLEIITSTEELQALPETSVVMEEYEAYAFVYEDGKALRKNILIGSLSDGFVHIKDGLDPSEVVLAGVTSDLKDGTEVNVE